MHIAQVVSAMPPAMSHKRSIRNCASNNARTFLPDSKRQCLDSNGILARGECTENEGALSKSDDKQERMLLDVQPDPSTGVTNLSSRERSTCIKEVQLQQSYTPCVLSPTSVPSAALKSKGKLNGYELNSRTKKPAWSEFHQAKESRLLEDDNVKNERRIIGISEHAEVMDSETSAVDKSSLPKSNDSESDVDSNCTDSSRTSIPRSMIKRPTVMLMKVNQPKKQSSTSQANSSMSLEELSALFGGYVHRMASLNARACVSAIFEPERKTTTANSPTRKRIAKSVTRRGPRKSILSVGPSQHAQKDGPSRSKGVVLNVNAVIPVIKLEPSGFEVPACAMIVQGIPEHRDHGEIPYNKLGLLHNGDSMHPDAQVFLSRSSKNQLEMPRRIYPTLVPSRLSTVRRASLKATSTGVVHYPKKRYKVNSNIINNTHLFFNSVSSHNRDSLVYTN